MKLPNIHNKRIIVERSDHWRRAWREEAVFYRISPQDIGPERINTIVCLLVILIIHEEKTKEMYRDVIAVHDGHNGNWPMNSVT